MQRFKLHNLHPNVIRLAGALRGVLLDILLSGGRRLASLIALPPRHLPPF
jgi:hypothetical protein